MSNRATCKDSQKAFKAGNHSDEYANDYVYMTKLDKSGKKVRRCVRRALMHLEYGDKRESQIEAARVERERRGIAREQAKQQRENPILAAHGGFVQRIREFFGRMAGRKV